MFFRRRAPAPTFDLQQLCNLAVRRLIAAGNTTWHENAFLPEHYADPTESAEALKILCARHLLTEAGDYEGAGRVFEGLKASGFSEGEPFRFMRLMCAHLSAAIGSTRLSPISNDKSIVGLVVWGDSYIEQLGDCTIPSLLAQGNLPALQAQSDTTFLVHTRRPDCGAVEALFRKFRLHNLLQIECIPDELIEASKTTSDLRFGDLKYWLLGALQSIQLHRARQAGARFWALFPDGLYSEEYMKTVMAISREGKGTVLLSGFKAKKDELTAALAGAATVPAPRLIELAMTHAHEYYKTLFVKPGQRNLPRQAGAFYNCGNTVRIHTPHYNIAMIDAATLRLSAPRFYLTLDASIEKISPLENCHFHRPEDQYFGTELAGDEPMYPHDLSEADYVNHLTQHSNALQLEFYRRPYTIAVAPSWLTSERLTSDAEVDAHIARLSGLAGPRAKDPALQNHLDSAATEMTRRANS